MEGKVNNTGKGRDYVGTHGLNGFGKDPINAGSLVWVEGFDGSLGFRDEEICHVYLWVCMEIGSELIVCMIETLKCFVGGWHVRERGCGVCKSH